MVSQMLSSNARNSLTGTASITPYEHVLTRTHTGQISTVPRMRVCRGRMPTITGAIAGGSTSSLDDVTTAEKALETYPTTKALQSLINFKTDIDVATEVPVSHTGQLPNWLNGSYIKNGPGVFPSPTGHLFDGYGLVSKVRFQDGRAFFTSRFVESNSFQQFMRTGQPQFREFGTGLALWKEVLNTFKMMTGVAQGVTDNSSVNVYPIPDSTDVLTVTEVPGGTYQVDTTTLRTIGQFKYEDELRDNFTTAHGSVRGDYLYNITSDIGKGFTVYRQHLKSNKREVLARVPFSFSMTPAWVHDFPASVNYLVIPETPITFNLGALFGGSSEYVGMDWNPQHGSRLHIVRLADGHVTTVDAPAYMTFHYVNCQESPDGSRLMFDFPWNEDPRLLNNLLLQEMQSRGDKLPVAPIRRLSVSLDGKGDTEVLDLTPPDEYLELPTINPTYEGVSYRYTYGLTATRPAVFGNSLGKFDIQSGQKWVWHESGSVPTEPLFVERPGAVEEDDGVVLCYVTQADGNQVLLVLDGKSFEEVARVQIPTTVGYQFHGKFLWNK